MPRITMLKSGITKLNGQSVVMPGKQRAAHYGTPQHVAWSNQVRERAGFQCQRCGRRGVRLFADHIVEVKDGGTWSLSNGQCLCGSCNTAKGMVARAKRAFAKQPVSTVKSKRTTVDPNIVYPNKDPDFTFPEE